MGVLTYFSLYPLPSQLVQEMVPLPKHLVHLIFTPEFQLEDDELLPDEDELLLPDELLPEEDEPLLPDELLPEEDDPLLPDELLPDEDDPLLPDEDEPLLPDEPLL